MKLFNYTMQGSLKISDNYAFMIDVAVNVGLALFQEIAPLANMKMYLKVDFHELIHPAKFESE